MQWSMSGFESSIISAIRDRVSLESRGDGAYLVHTGFTFPDGDELHIALRRTGTDWTLTDDGHTAMWLSYERPEMNGSSKTMLERIVASNGVSLDDGSICTDCTESDIGQRLRTVIQAILQAASILYLED